MEQLAEQVRQLHSTVAPRNGIGSTPVTATTATASPSTGGGRPRCWWCCETGHLQRECPCRPRLPTSPCPTCGGKHWKAQCPQSADVQVAWENLRRLYRVTGHLSSGGSKTSVKFLLDTEATVSLLPTTLAEEMGLAVRPTQVLNIYSFAEKPHPVEGKTATRFTLGSESREVIFSVSSAAPKAILGMPTLRAFGITLGCGQDVISLADGEKLFCSPVSGAGVSEGEPAQKTEQAGADSAAPLPQVGVSRGPICRKDHQESSPELYTKWDDVC